MTKMPSKKALKKKSKPFKETYSKPREVVRMSFIVTKQDADKKSYKGSETLLVKVY